MNPLQSGQVLITGAAGLIGSALGRALDQKGLSNLVLSDHLAGDER